MGTSNKYLYITFGIGCVVYLIGNLLSDGFDYASVNDFMIDFGIYQLYGFMLGYSNYFFFAHLEKRDWKKTDRWRRIVIGLLGSAVITTIGLFMLNAFMVVVFEGNTWNHFITHLRWEQFSFGMWITMTIVVTFHIIYFYNRYQQNKVKEQKVIAGTANAKFDALKNQLDPHFLFNSLNVLTSLIDENPDNAQKFTTSLSKVYRYVLEQKNKDLVTVDEELDFARTYMLLLKMRFEDSIIFEIPDKASNAEAKVVPLSLQLLLENAVKHNTVTTNKPLLIKIYEQQGMLVVENNLQPKQIVKKSSGVGLDNIQQRYGLLTNKKVIINQEADSFAVAIPMLTKQLSIMDFETRDNQRDAYYKAKKRVEEIKGFYGNIISYILVIPFLVFINYRTSWEFQWFWFPMLGWGMGIVFHAFGVFGYSKSWEERKIRQFMEQDRHTNTWN